MTTLSTHRVSTGVYEIVGSKDDDGKPYRVVKTEPTYEGYAPENAWHVLDSRGRAVSFHFTKRDAVESVEPLDYETCSWCSDEVLDSSLTEIDDGARLCGSCLADARDSGRKVVR